MFERIKKFFSKETLVKEVQKEPIKEIKKETKKEITYEQLLEKFSSNDSLVSRKDCFYPSDFDRVKNFLPPLEDIERIYYFNTFEVHSSKRFLIKSTKFKLSDFENKLKLDYNYFLLDNWILRIETKEKIYLFEEENNYKPEILDWNLSEFEYELEEKIVHYAFLEKFEKPLNDLIIKFDFTQQDPKELQKVIYKKYLTLEETEDVRSDRRMRYFISKQKENIEKLKLTKEEVLIKFFTHYSIFSEGLDRSGISENLYALNTEDFTFRHLDLFETDYRKFKERLINEKVERKFK